MNRNFFSLGYNLANPQSIIPRSISMNDHEYSAELENPDPINVTSWWNPEVVTKIDGLFDIQLEDIYADCSLNSSDEIYLAVYAYSPGTKLLHQGEIVPISDGQVSAGIIIPAFELANAVDFHAAIICRFPADSPRKVGAPVISNSKLAGKSWRFALSGSHTQVNVLNDDFSLDARTEHSIWKIHLEDTSDYDEWLIAQHSSVLRITVNQDLQEFVKQDHVQALLMTDLVMTALQSAIEDDERLLFLQSGFYPEGTWVQFIKKYFDLVFVNQTLGVRDYWHNEQPEIRSRIQHLMHGNLELK